MSTCCVCYEKIPKNYPKLSCGHCVHSKCMRKWCKPTCPLCRSFVSINKNTRSEKRKREVYAQLDLLLTLLTDMCYKWSHQTNYPNCNTATSILLHLEKVVKFIWENRVILRRNPNFVDKMTLRIPELVNSIKMWSLSTNNYLNVWSPNTDILFTIKNIVKKM